MLIDLLLLFYSSLTLYVEIARSRKGDDSAFVMGTRPCLGCSACQRQDFE